jgi:23S rRNA U2552 (ribose-2'-O)-methylase RlmE/FtsJ
VPENILSRPEVKRKYVEGIDIMQISVHKNVSFINNYSTLSEERHKKISNILSNNNPRLSYEDLCTNSHSVC